MVKKSTHQRYRIILNVHIPNNITSKCIKQNLIELQEEIKNFLECWFFFFLNFEYGDGFMGFYISQNLSGQMP